MDRLTEETQLGPFASLKDKAETRPGAFHDYDYTRTGSSVYLAGNCLGGKTWLAYDHKKGGEQE